MRKMHFNFGSLFKLTNCGCAHLHNQS
uniref:Uncharacterized protein n=1 Tax=Anguilla anguilla TaxID=7936 RepID=A0A0E9W1Y4_ANGAN